VLEVLQCIAGGDAVVEGGRGHYVPIVYPRTTRWSRMVEGGRGLRFKGLVFRVLGFGFWTEAECDRHGTDNRRLP